VKNVEILYLIVSTVFKYFRKKNAPSKNDRQGEIEERKNGEKRHPSMNN
jgi:hypothetical protein